MPTELDPEADLAAVEKIAEVVNKFNDPAVQMRAFELLAGRVFGESVESTRDDGPPYASGATGASDTASRDGDGTEDSQRRSPRKKQSTAKGGRKANFDVPKDVNYAPSNKKSLQEFANEKNPGNNEEKALVAAYYLKKTLERTVTTGEVIGVFKALGWNNPAHPDNNLQKAGTRHWLDTSDMNDIKLSWSGENYVESTLPKAKKTK